MVFGAVTFIFQIRSETRLISVFSNVIKVILVSLKSISETIPFSKINWDEKCGLF